MLRRAMTCIVEDESFHIPVEPAFTALHTAKRVVQWANANEEAFLYFEGLAHSTLSPCVCEQRVPKVRMGMYVEGFSPTSNVRILPAVVV